MPYLKMTAVTLAMTCCISDLIYGKIFNFFWLAGVFCGGLENLVLSGKSGGGASLIGCFFPLAVGAWLFYFRMIGAGDIKELSAVGAVAGMRMTVKICVCSFVFGACIAGILCLMDTDLMERLHYFFQWMTQRFIRHERVPYMQTDKGRDAIRKRVLPPGCFHFSVPVFMAVLFYAGGYWG